MHGVLGNKLVQYSILLNSKGMGLSKIIEWRWVKYGKPGATEEYKHTNEMIESAVDCRQNKK